MSQMHGQLDDRAERIRKTSQWLGASPVSDFGEVIREEPADYEPNPEIVRQIVEQIRIAFSVGHGCVRVGERHRATCEAVHLRLTDEERARVIYDIGNIHDIQHIVNTSESPEIPQPGDPRPTKVRRDINRPNIVRVEDGTLRPL